MILSEEELLLRKEDARKREIRQNVKSHCTKIRDGIRKNGSTSGNRAIWELFQNAGDLAKNGCANIRITLSNDAFVFAHQGKPFTFDSLCSLVKQVSSEEKENEFAVGQYGTGFLTTHKFSRKITVNGSMLISENPIAFVDVDNFLINRENFDDIPLFIDDMTAQIMAVNDMMDSEQKEEAKEWTTFSYELNEERKTIAQTAIDEAIKLIPYVLTFNDNIESCTINDITRNRKISFTKKDKCCSVADLKCKQINIEENGNVKDFFCYYLETHDGESRIILPLKSETQVCSLGNTPRLFVHFPLIGPNNFGVNFLFHSHKFIPEEPRDNIIVPKDNDATDKAAAANQVILNEMTFMLWKFLEENVHTWTDTIKMASLHIKDYGYSELKTEAYYKSIKESWVAEFEKLKLIETNGVRYSMSDEKHPLVLESTLESFISTKEDKDYLSVIYPYAKDVTTIPSKDELIQWSQIVAEWNPSKTDYYLTLEDIVKFISQNKDCQLHDMLQLIVDAGQSDFFEKYALIPNREGVLRKRSDLRDAKPIVKDLYDLVKSLNPAICEKMVDEDYADIVSLTKYTRSNLREELNAIIKTKEDECWRNSENPTFYDGDFEKNLIALCSTFTTTFGDSKRNRLMPIICRFEGIEYHEKHIAAWESDASNFDLYRQIFVSLVENQMLKIQKKDSVWVEQNISDLVLFVDNARGDDYKNFCTQYAIYPDMNGVLHKPEALKKKDKVNDELFYLYEQVIGEYLKSKCVDERFELFYTNYSQDAYKYTAQKVAKDIQNKLSEGQYKYTILIDIIELTENETNEGYQWRMLFKDIYDQRETIRYNLGSDIERKAINKMLKRKNPALMIKMADVSEREDAEIVLNAINETIDKLEHDAYIKKLGNYAESHIQRFLTEELSKIDVRVKNQQGGQDFILSKDGYENYHIEVKSRWESEQSVEMSMMQFARAVEFPDRYALISMNMYHFDKKLVEREECTSLTELLPNIKVLDNIGSLESDLHRRAEEAFSGADNEIRLNGSYTVRVPQNIFDLYPLSFDNFVSKLKCYFAENSKINQ